MKKFEVQSTSNAYETLYKILATKGLKPYFQKNYNKATNILIQILQYKNIDFQLVPPNMHWRNAAERAI